MDMNLQKYFAFVKAVEYGSITKAAEVLAYSQSGISRMIHDLEQEWHLSLLERGKGGVKLTSDGMRLLPFATSVCNEFQKMQMEVDELRGLQSGLIRIGTFSSVATHWAPRIIKRFQRDYPNIDYELLLGDYTEIETWIQEGRVDCGFVRLPTNSELDTFFLEQDRLMAVVPEDHPLAQKREIPLRSLVNEPFMMLERGANAEVAELFARHELAPKVHFTTWDDYAIMSMVESGLGVSILPELILHRLSYRIAVRPLDVPAYRNIALAVRDKKSVSLVVKRFIDYLDYRKSE